MTELLEMELKEYARKMSGDEVFDICWKTMALHDVSALKEEKTHEVFAMRLALAYMFLLLNRKANENKNPA